MEPAEYALMDEAEDRMWWYRALHARMLASLPATAGRVLDAGCGTGGLLACIRAARPGLDLHGIEFFARAATRAREKSGAATVRGTVNGLPYAERSFDAVLAADVLCHEAVDPPVALREFARVLRPGGLLVVNMPAFAWLASSHDRRVHNARRQSAGELRAVLEAAGFGSVHARYWNGLLLPLMIAHRKLRARRPDAASDVAVFPPWLDAMLHAVAAFEQRLPLKLPAGGSVLARAVRVQP